MERRRAALSIFIINFTLVLPLHWRALGYYYYMFGGIFAHHAGVPHSIMYTASTVGRVKTISEYSKLVDAGSTYAKVLILYIIEG